MNSRGSGRCLVWLIAMVCVFAGCDEPDQPAGGGTGEGGASPPIVAAARGQVGKTVIYDGTYVKLDYPGGDLPLERGVCTDVIVRALREGIGMDLQMLVHEDMTAEFSAYPKHKDQSRPDRSIDHRRTENLRRFFERQEWALAVTEANDDYLPGDLVTCRVGHKPHIMIVSDAKTDEGQWLVIHNIGEGAVEEEGLFKYPITGHYRIPAKPAE